MDEYIERNGLLKWAIEFYPNEKVFASAVINAPAADVQEVRHGKWIYVDGVLDWADYKCSECGYIEKFGDDTCLYNYCPECGAKMNMEI